MGLLEACKRASERVHTFLDLEDQSQLHQDTRNKVKETYEVLKEALERYTMNEIALSYNGGKDCLVMLVIFLCVIYDTRHECLLKDETLKLNTIFVNTEESFKEMDEFLRYSVEEYQLSFVQLKDELKSGFAHYLELNPNIRSIIVGIRRIDPYGESLTFFEQTDHNWPSFLRIHPVLNWEYTEIWHFIRSTNIRYCQLYDMGYTSIGGTHNTVPNPYLLKDGEFLPAWKLNENDKERLSRI